MDQWLALPEIQSGVIPFLSALIMALVLITRHRRWSGVGLIVGFLLAFHWVEGGQWLPLSSSRKLAFIAVGAALVGFIGATIDDRRHLQWLLGVLVLVAGAGLWLIWPLLLRQQGWSLFVLAGASVAYAVWFTGTTNGLRHEPLKLTTTLWVAGFGTGITAILGSSAKLGQLGLALGSAAGALCLVAIFNSRYTSSTGLSLPGALLIALLGIAGVVYAQLAWYSLLPLALIPAVLAAVKVSSHRHRFVQAVILGVCALPLAVIAVVITGVINSGGNSSGY